MYGMPLLCSNYQTDNMGSIREYSKGKYHCTNDLLFDWFGLVCFANKTKIVSCHTADSKPVKQEVNGTVILPPLVFPDSIHSIHGQTLADRMILWPEFSTVEVAE
jgi:hypothetical protein